MCPCAARRGRRTSQLLFQLRAARLVGVSRGALQRKMRNGELATLEGMVSAEDLLRANPEARLENGAALERLERIKETALARCMRERALPSAEVLMVRLGGIDPGAGAGEGAA